VSPLVQPDEAPAVVIFDNFGPYHVARVAAAAKRVHLIAIELKGRSKTYGWSPPTDLPFAKTSLTTPAEDPSPPLVARRLREKLAKVRPSVVFVNGWFDFLSPTTIRWCAKHRVPFVVMSESPLPRTEPPAAREWVKSRIVRLAAAALVGGEPHAAYVRQLGVPAEAVFAGYDAVDNDHFHRGAEAARQEADGLRQKLRLPRNYFLASKRFVPKKNIARLLEAFAGYRAQAAVSGVEAWDLVLLGDGPQQAEVQSKIEQLRLSGFVHLPGFRAYHELPAYYGLAGAFIHASVHEEWGLVVNEALAAGLPVLLSRRCGCALDLLVEGQNGFGFEPEQTGELQKLMTQVARPDCNRAGLGEAGRRIVQRFSPENFGEAFARAAARAKARTRQRPGLLDRAILKALDRA
jgi:1,2-diacylglycerol 3-alpha-glucosyltransferase